MGKSKHAIHKTAMKNDETAPTPNPTKNQRKNGEFKKFKAMACRQLK